MSLRPTFASLYGFDAQHVIPALEELNRLVQEQSPDDIDLENIIERLNLFAERLRPRRGIINASYSDLRWKKHPVTTDHYRWFGALEGSTRDGNIALLFPYCSDLQNRDGTKLDRRIALYTQGDVDLAAVNGFVRQVCMEYVGVLSEKKEESDAISRDRFKL